MEPPAPPPNGETTSSTAAGGPARAVEAAVSLGDVERSRRESVLAYCARLCDPDRIAEAVDASFAGLRGALETADGHAALDLDRILLEATRASAAERSDASAALPGFAGLSLRRSSACELMPRLLAAQASQLLGSADLERVERHLARCAACRELERRRAEAERAYHLLRGDPPGAAEPFASPGDEAPEIAAVGPAAVPVAAAEPTDRDDEPAEEYAFELSPPEPLGEAPGAADGDDHTVVAAEPPTGQSAIVDDQEPPPAGFDAGTADTAEAEAVDPETQALDAEPEQLDAAAGSSPPRRSAWRTWGAVVAPLATGAIAIAVLAAVMGDEEEDPRPAAQERPAAATPQRPQEPAPEARPSRADRTRARLDALGDRLLGPGMRGSDVKALQRLLGVPQTGTYGALTEYAVGEFQAAHDMPVDGRAGAATKRRLARRPRPPRTPPALPPAASDRPASEAGGDSTPDTPPSPGGQPSPAPPSPDAQSTPGTPGPGSP